MNNVKLRFYLRVQNVGTTVGIEILVYLLNLNLGCANLGHQLALVHE